MPAAAAPIRTLLVGDSITFGIVSDPIGPSYAELLSADLAATHDVVNIAVSGSSAFYWGPSTPCPGICSTADTLFDEMAAPELPADLATVLLGTNDESRRSAPTPSVSSAVPTSSTCSPATDFEIGDIHPNAFGHQRIATALAETIRAIPEPEPFLLVACGLIALGIRLPTRLQGQ